MTTDRRAELRAAIERQLPHALDTTKFEHLGERFQGKVRDTYAQGNRLVLITTDRISAFDHVLRQTIPFKGQVLNQTAAYFLEHTRDVAPNHLIDVPDPNVTVAKRCQALPIEFVVRGYLAGHAWRSYNNGLRHLCGERLPEGLRQSDKLPQPILTPATKAAEGHDEDISQAEILERGLLDSASLERCEAVALALFQRGTQMAAERGLLLVDTKYEFGRDEDGTLLVIDEIHTPDSSRYYYADGYDERLEQGEPQRQLSKEFVREWLMDHGFQGKDGQVLPDLTDEFRTEVSLRYIELYEAITGNMFDASVSVDVPARIKTALQ
ncbi:MAG: phosphoribosylaminoimidazolesuccinocarboxamide synthase [Bacteroidota bacterium]